MEVRAFFIVGRVGGSVKAPRCNAGALVFCNPHGDWGHLIESSGVTGRFNERRGGGDDSGNLSDELR